MFQCEVFRLLDQVFCTFEQKDSSSGIATVEKMYHAFVVACSCELLLITVLLVVEDGVVDGVVVHGQLLAE